MERPPEDERFDADLPLDDDLRPRELPLFDDVLLPPLFACLFTVAYARRFASPSPTPRSSYECSMSFA